MYFKNHNVYVLTRTMPLADSPSVQKCAPNFKPSMQFLGSLENIGSTGGKMDKLGGKMNTG